MGHVALRALSDQSSVLVLEIRLLISMLNNDNNVEQSTAICCGHHPPHNHFQESHHRLCPKKDAADAWRSMMLDIILSSESGTAFKVHSCELEINRYYDDKLVFADLCCERGQATNRKNHSAHFSLGPLSVSSCVRDVDHILLMTDKLQHCCWRLCCVGQRRSEWLRMRWVAKLWRFLIHWLRAGLVSCFCCLRVYW